MDLKSALYFFAKMDEEAYALSEGFFVKKEYKKGAFVNVQDKLGSHLGYIVKGFFRVYYIHPKTGKQISLYFFQENNFMFSFLLFSSETPSNYYLEVLEDAEILEINHTNLTHLYRISHKWEHFGRLLAEEYYRGSNTRTESFIFKTPEERYLDLIQTFPTIFQRTSLLKISSYLGIESQSLSRIRKRLVKKRK
jgi:CRP-like cAMP-binding protein